VVPGTDVRQLEGLLEVSQTLGSTPDLRAALSRVLDLLHESHAAVASQVCLPAEQGGDLAVEAAKGPRATVARKLRYRLGEGITGRVAQTGKPIVVPHVSQEPLFLNRSGLWRSGGPELSYICVPITGGPGGTGALGVAYEYRKDRRYDQEARFLGIAGAMVGQAAKVHGLMDAERRRLQDENSLLRQELRGKYDLRHIVGDSRLMQQVYDAVAQVAPSVTTVLIRGESGTGKELVAHAIHYSSPRADKPFIKVSCGALPEALIESELFGYEPGAFTDARRQKKGRFDLAHGGTLFLDEIGELTPTTQVKLLRVLQEREFERLGGVRPVKVDVRVVAATNKDLEVAVKQGSFREDLYYRLNVFSIFLPPLRDRRPDIPLLADHFVETYAASHHKDVRRIATTAIDMMMSYHWPGNVRELENCIERAVLVCDGGAIHAHHLPPTLQTAEVSGTLARHSLAKAVASYEKDLIQDALKSARGNRARAARLLDSTERIVGYKVRKYGIDEDRFKTS
jgi:Nif-specific regulatory protein